MTLRKTLQWCVRVGIVGALIISALFFIPPQAAYAATITVGGTCTLIDAIIAANTDAPSGGCPAGSGADTIVLSGNISLTAVHNTTDGDNGLPSVTSVITISGGGFGVNRTGGPPFRIFHVAAGGNLTLNRLTVSGGIATNAAGGPCAGGSCGGGLYNANGGTVSLASSTFSNNSAATGGGGIFNGGSSTLNVTGATFNNNTTSDDGGAIRNLGAGSAVTIGGGTVFTGNSAVDGAGLHNAGGGTVNINDSTFNLNSSTSSGGAIRTVSPITVVDSAITNNTTTGNGGAISGTTMTLINTTVSGNTATFNGGGLIGNTITLNNSTVSGNSAGAANNGGGVYGNTITILSSTISGNSAGAGGGVYTTTTVSISNSTIRANSASGANGGGGIYNLLGPVDIINSTIGGSAPADGNQANAGPGGGIRNASPSGTVTINGSDVSRNTAAGGAGLANTGAATVNITNSVFANNTASADGGAIANTGTGTVNLTASTLSANSAGSNNGGGLYNTGTVVITNSTLSGNTAGSGGGVNNGGAATVTYTTFSGNTATTGGGINSTAGTVTISNSIVANSGAGGDCVGVGYTAANNRATGQCGTTAVTNLDATLANNGGPTQTHALLLGSNAIDAGLTCPPPANDQRGLPRPVATGCDIGSFESGAQLATLSYSINNTTINENPPGVATVTVTLNNPNATALPSVTAFFSITGTAAGGGNDYTLAGLGTQQEIVFSPVNPGNNSAAFTITAVNDSFFELNETVILDISFTGPATLSGPANQTVTIVSDEVIGVTVAPPSGTLTVNETGPTSANYTAVLRSEPTGVVTFTLTTNGQCTVNPATLNFTPTGFGANWNAPQTVTVTAVDDTVPEISPHLCAITHTLSSTDPDYNGQVLPYNVGVLDQDVASDTLAMFNTNFGWVSLLNTLQDQPPAGAYNNYFAGAPAAGSWVMGDWNGDRLKTPGVYSNGTFWYTNVIGQTSSWNGVWIGPTPAKPVAGRFSNTVNRDCIGVVVSDLALYWTCDLSTNPTLNGQWLGGQLTGQTGEYQFTAGDFDNDGLDTIAIRRGEVIAWTNVPPTTALAQFTNAQYIGAPLPGQYGNVLSGDWDVNQVDSFGLFFETGTFVYRNDLDWNSGQYLVQRVGQPIGASPLTATSWLSLSGTPLSEASSGVEVAPTPTPAQPGATSRQLIESDDLLVKQSGVWSSSEARAASGGSYLYSGGSGGDTLTLEFEGTFLEVVFVRHPALGAFTIVVDDTAVRTVVTSANFTTFNQRTVVLYLPPGRHTMQIVPIDGAVAIDAFYVPGVPAK